MKIETVDSIRFMRLRHYIYQRCLHYTVRYDSGEKRTVSGAALQLIHRAVAGLSQDFIFSEFENPEGGVTCLGDISRGSANAICNVPQEHWDYAAEGNYHF